jgi:anti-sigma regulatory factor (Ser/Thr protein kinase)
MASELSAAAGLYAWLDAALPRSAAPGDVLARIHVALEEAVVNAVLHGFPAGVVGEITVRVSRVGETVRLTVEDNGKAFDPTAAAPRPRAQSLS